MTGDGAVVRQMEEARAALKHPADIPTIVALNAGMTAIRQQAAEIERLTAKMAEWEAVLVHHTPLKLRLNISEARTADLLKLIADLADNLSDEGVIYSDDGLDDRRKRVADALGNDCPEWLLEHQSAAAKGGTV